jgi:HK97 family phage major capsid protein
MRGNYVPASIESLQDIGYLQDFVQSDISRAVLDKEEDDYTTVLLDPTSGATPYTATSVAVTSPESFLDIVAAQKSAYDANSSWLMSKSVGLALYKQQIADNQFLQFWTRQNGRAYFHDFPVYYSSRMKGAKTAGSPPTAHDAVAFGDFKAGFIIGDRNNSAILIKVDDITDFKNGIINVFAYRRSGALVRNQEALQQVTL